jgi:hypothetical protein
MPTVEQRLERLERSQKRYRFATIGLLCLVIAGVSMGQAKGVEGIVCRSLTVTGDDGNVLVKIGRNPFGGRVTVFNDEGQPTTDISHTFAEIESAKSGLISVSGTDGLVVLELKGDKNGGKILGLNKKKTRDEALEFYVDHNGYGRMESARMKTQNLEVTNLYDRTVFKVRTTATGSGSLNIYNELGNSIGGLEGNPLGDPIFYLNNRNGKSIFKVYSHTENKGAKLKLYDGGGKEIVSYGNPEKWEK